jgi:hypothetical protein
VDDWLAVVVGALIALIASVIGAIISRRGADKKAELDEQQRQRERHDEYVRGVRDISVELITAAERFLRASGELLVSRRELTLGQLGSLEEDVHRIADSSELFQLSSEASDANESAREMQFQAFMVWSEFGMLSLDPTSTTAVQKELQALQSALITFRGQVRTAFASSAQMEARKKQLVRDEETHGPVIDKLMEKIKEQIEASARAEPHPREPARAEQRRGWRRVGFRREVPGQ